MEELGEDASSISIKEAFGKSKNITYEYDFGDSWEHTIKLEKRLKSEAVSFPVPHCLEGENACPPEDCGGAMGFIQLKEALANPNAEESQDLLEWLEELIDNYDPSAFDIKEVNKQLTPKKSKKTGR